MVQCGFEEGDVVLECPICLETYQDPVLFSRCGHSFCRRCVASLLRAQERRIWCPTCRAGPVDCSQVKPNYALQRVLESAHATLIGSSQPVRVDILPLKRVSCGALSFRRSPSQESLCDRTSRIRSLGLPPGLSRLVAEEDQQIACRIYILDNSGSTAAGDGHVLEQHTGFIKSVDCTRWEEICQMAREQARWNAAVGCPCEFILLNGPGMTRIDSGMGDTTEQIANLERMLRPGPKGVTPLARCLIDVGDQVRSDEERLRSFAETVVIVVATDGLPTQPSASQTTTMDREELSDVVKHIGTNLPVFIVFRLTTDDDEVVDFYNSLDAEIELPLEVLDDIHAEAKEVAGCGNRWLAYSQHLHRLREAGTLNKYIDLLDERALSLAEVRLLAQILVEPVDAEPLPRDPPEAFKILEVWNAESPLVYDAVTRTMSKPLRIPELRKTFLGKRRSSTCAMQ